MRVCVINSDDQIEVHGELKAWRVRNCEAIFNSLLLVVFTPADIPLVEHAGQGVESGKRGLHDCEEVCGVEDHDFSVEF